MRPSLSLIIMRDGIYLFFLHFSISHTFSGSLYFLSVYSMVRYSNALNVYLRVVCLLNTINLTMILLHRDNEQPDALPLYEISLMLTFVYVIL